MSRWDIFQEGGGRAGGMTVTENKDVCLDYASLHTTSHPPQAEQTQDKIGEMTRVSCWWFSGYAIL